MRSLITITLFLLTMSQKTFSQTMHAQYKVTLKAAKLLGILPVELHCIYNVWANNEFIEIIGSNDSLTSTFPSNFSLLDINAINRHLIIQKNTGIGYFLDEQKYVYVQTIKAKKITKKNDCYVLKDKSGVRFYLCNRINKNMTPGLLFNPAQINGVQSAVSKNITMKLITTISNSSRKIDYDSIFSNANQIKDTINFFN